MKRSVIMSRFKIGLALAAGEAGQRRTIDFIIR